MLVDRNGDILCVDEHCGNGVLVAIYMPPRKTPDPWDWLLAAIVFMGLWWVLFG